MFFFVMMLSFASIVASIMAALTNTHFLLFMAGVYLGVAVFIRAEVRQREAP